MSWAEAECTIANDTAELARVRGFVGEGVRAGGFPADLLNQVSLAVDEAVANIIEHAFAPEASGRIRLHQKVDGESYSILIEDDGAVDFDPTIVPDLDIAEHVAAGRNGGLGLHIMCSIMDVVDFGVSTSPGFRHRLLLARLVRPATTNRLRRRPG